MLLAKGFVFVWFVGVFVAGLAGGISALLAAIGRWSARDRRAAKPLNAACSPEICPNPGCQHTNPPGAKFCARCGLRLSG